MRNGKVIKGATLHRAGNSLQQVRSRDVLKDIAPGASAPWDPVKITLNNPNRFTLSVV